MKVDQLPISYQTIKQLENILYELYFTTKNLRCLKKEQGDLAQFNLIDFINEVTLLCETLNIVLPTIPKLTDMILLLPKEDNND